MRLPGRGELEALLANADDITVSIYLPTQRTGDVQQGGIRLKNLLREVTSGLQLVPWEEATVHVLSHSQLHQAPGAFADPLKRCLLLSSSHSAASPR